MPTSITSGDVNQYIREKYGSIPEARRQTGIRSASLIRAQVARELAQQRNLTGRQREQSERLAQRLEQKAQVKAQQSRTFAKKDISKLSRGEIIAQVQSGRVTKEEATQEIFKRTPSAQVTEQKLKEEPAVYITTKKTTSPQPFYKPTLSTKYIVKKPEVLTETQTTTVYSNVPLKTQEKALSYSITTGEYKATPKGIKPTVSPNIDAQRQQKISKAVAVEKSIEKGYQKFFTKTGLKEDPKAKGFFGQAFEEQKSFARAVYRIPQGAYTTLLSRPYIIYQGTRADAKYSFTKALPSAIKETPLTIAKSYDPRTRAGRSSIILTGIAFASTYSTLKQPPATTGIFKAKVIKVSGKAKTVTGKTRGLVRPVGVRKASQVTRFTERTRFLRRKVDTTIIQKASGEVIQIQKIGSKIYKTTFQQGAKKATLQVYKNGKLIRTSKVKGATDQSFEIGEGVRVGKKVPPQVRRLKIDGREVPNLAKQFSLEKTSYSIKGVKGSRLVKGDIIQTSKVRVSTRSGFEKSQTGTIYDKTFVPTSQSTQLTQLIIKKGVGREPKYISAVGEKTSSSIGIAKTAKAPIESAFEFSSSYKGTLYSSRLPLGRRAQLGTTQELATVKAPLVGASKLGVSPQPIQTFTYTPSLSGGAGVFGISQTIRQKETRPEPFKSEISIKSITETQLRAKKAQVSEPVSKPISETKTAPISKVKSFISPVSTTKTAPVSRQSVTISPAITPQTRTRQIAQVKQTPQYFPKPKFRVSTTRLTPTYRPLFGFSFFPKRGGTFGTYKQRATLSQPKGYTPSAFSASFGITGTPTKGGIVSGLGARPIKKKKKRLF